jgi:hypothetical protein
LQSHDTGIKKKIEVESPATLDGVKQRLKRLPEIRSDYKFSVAVLLVSFNTVRDV